jgi:hypothetical protein
VVVVVMMNIIIIILGVWLKTEGSSSLLPTSRLDLRPSLQ